MTVLKGGFQSLLQDTGRYGSQGLGVTTGGPMDCHGFAWANQLVGNTANRVALEVCLGNFLARFDGDVWFSITGADLHWQLDGKPLRPWRSYQAKAGAVIGCHTAKAGLRGYLAVQGGFKVPLVLDSCATVTGDRLGGLGRGRRLVGGDEIPYLPGLPGRARRTPENFIPHYGSEMTLRVAPTNQFDQFSECAIRHFFSMTYTLSTQMDRMGCRLNGVPLTDVPGNMVSEAVPLGAIQVPGDGKPIILLQDRQTIGGYPKLGNVYAVDLNGLAQLKPGDKIHFQLGDLQEAQQELAVFRHFFNWNLPRLNRLHTGRLSL